MSGMFRKHLKCLCIDLNVLHTQCTAHHYMHNEIHVTVRQSFV